MDNYIISSGIRKNQQKSVLRKRVEILRKSVTVKARYWDAFQMRNDLRQPGNSG